MKVAGAQISIFASSVKKGRRFRWEMSMYYTRLEDLSERRTISIMCSADLVGGAPSRLW
jgi:hypothetical protein